ncbi:MAG: hypothetical protein HFG67_00715 [Firmicutes bacterium]|nr:hypothetical protein [Bacillota bacterium]
MPLFILGGIVIVCCIIYILFSDHPELFAGGKAAGSGKSSVKEDNLRRADDKPKVIYLPQNPEDIEAEKARRSKRKK